MKECFKRPESVLVVIYTRGREVLVLRRRQPPDFWQSVTGSLAWGEKPLAAAKRELFEETGLGGEAEVLESRLVNRFPILPAWRARYAPDVRENVEHVFQVELPEHWPITLSPEEHTDYLWLPRDQAAAKVSSYTNRDAILQLVSAS